MQFDKNKPIYLQIKREIKERIVRKEIKKELPTVRNLAKEVGVNPNTVARAYRDLERDNITGSRVGKGTWVKDRAYSKLQKEMVEEIVDSFIQSLYSLGLTLKEIKEIVEEIDD